MAIFLLFVYGLFALSPGRSLLPRIHRGAGVFAGQVSRVKDIPITGHSMISRAIFHKGKLYVGGDGGLTMVDPVTGEASKTVGLPEDFFVRDLVSDGNRIIIGGFSGIFVLENTVVKPFYQENQLPVDLINSLAVTGNNRLLIGSLGQGLLRGNENSAVFVLGTQGRTIRDFGRLGSELWIMHEDGILTGQADSFKPLNLQVLAGRHLRSMVTTDRSVFIGSDQGVIAGYRNLKNWVWTLLSAGKPGFVNDLLVSGDILFVGSDEGLYRFNNGRMERLSSIPCQALAADDSFLAAVNPGSVMLFYFAPFVGIKDSSRISTAPEVGSFTPSMPVVSMIPVPNLQFGRLPDFRSLDAGDEDSVVGKSASESLILDRPEPGLPPELQVPVFSDLEMVFDKYYMATKNRGIWLYQNSTWKEIDGVPGVGVESLAGNGTSCYAYGNGKGVFKILNDKATVFVREIFCNGLLNVHLSQDGSLLLLYENGSIKTTDENGDLKELASIPGEFSGEFHSIWKIGANLVVVVNKGVLVQESDKQWNLVFFKGRIEGSRVTSATIGTANDLYVAQNDGRIFRFAAGQLDFVGAINDLPVAMNYAGCLWVAGNDSLYFLEKNDLIAAPFHARDRILGAYPVPDSKSIMVFTGSGVKVIAGRQ
jgi:ligand-binding sensor domain-containing protein